MFRFSSTVRSRSLVRACGITPIERRAASGLRLTSCPAMRATPEVMGSSVVIMRMSVDFPAPLGPSRPKVSPSSTAKEISSTAVNSPYFFTMCSTSMALPALPLPPFGLMFTMPLLHRRRGLGFRLRRLLFALLIARLQHGRRHQHVGGHAGHKQLAGIVYTQLQDHGFNIALAPADIALGGEITFHRLEEDFASHYLPARHANVVDVAQGDAVGISFRHRRLHPGVAQIHNGDDGLAG